MRTLHLIMIGCGVVAAAGAGWYFFHGRSHPALGGDVCRVASFQERTVSGTANVCLRCVTGFYSATRWKNCATTPAKDKPGQVECGGTPIDPNAMCAVTDSPQQPAAQTPPPNDSANPPPANPPSTEPGTGTSPVVGDSGAPPATGTASASTGSPPPVTMTPPVQPPPGWSGNTKTVVVHPQATSGTPKPPGVVIKKKTGPSEDELYGGQLAPNEYGATTGASGGGGYAYVVGSMAQAEERDYYGRITREAAAVWVVACPNRRQIYVYQYLNRPAFRAIQPPDWGHALGGGDFASYETAVRAGCSG